MPSPPPTVEPPVVLLVMEQLIIVRLPEPSKPPPSFAVLLVITQAVKVTEVPVAKSTPPPALVPEVFPFEIVKLLNETDPAVMLKMRNSVPELRVTVTPAPPLMVRLLSISNSPVVRETVVTPEKTIMSPDTALAMALRKVPVPVLPPLVTVMVDA